MKKTKLIFKLLVLILILFSLSGCRTENLQQLFTESHGLKVCFLDCGQGDCSIIKLPDDRIMVIDSGENGQEEKILNTLDSFGITKIDYLIASHPHSDHIGAMSEIIDKYEIGEVYAPKITHKSKVFQEMVESLKKKNMKIKVARSGKTIVEDEKIDLKIDFLAPLDEKYDEYNNYSAVVRLVYQNRKFLFCGDIEKKVEREIVDVGDDITTDVMKVAHHGSASSSSEEFLDATKPLYAVISCGKNNEYGHPSDIVLQKFENIRANVYNTAKDGDILFVVDRGFMPYTFK